MTFPQIDPVAFSVGPLAVHWYGLTYLFGFAGAWLLASWRAGKPGSPFNREQVGDLIFYGAVGVIVGGRLGYGLFYGLDQWLRDPLWIIKLQQGGMSFHGGMLGVLTAFWYFKRKTGKSYFTVADFIVPMVPVGLATGRIGNFINGELWGNPPMCPGAWCSPAIRCSWCAIRRSCISSLSKAWPCSPCCGSFRASHAPLPPLPACSVSVMAAPVSAPNFSGSRMPISVTCSATG
jgi:phosphatidylglycerol:prolipoprotein diacylglycerol transferase